jgi:hypothetical protein
MDDDQKPHVGPPDLILQAIVPPTDAPAEIRAAVADALARRDTGPEPSYTWEDVIFAASAIALVEGTNQRDVPDTQWVFALNVDSPKLGEQIHNTGSWASSTSRGSHWCVNVMDAVTTAPRGETPAA